MPSDTSVSIDVAPCRAFFSAALVERPRRPPRDRHGACDSTHCQPGNRDHGNSDNCTDRSLSGTKNTSATISRRRR